MIFAVDRKTSCSLMTCAGSAVVVVIVWIFNEYETVGIMFKILLIISVIVAIFCMCVVVACLLATAKENGLPDIDDIDLVELFSSKIQKV